MGVFADLRMRLSSSSPDDSTRLAVEHAVQVVDPRMTLVGSHQRKLAPVVGKALDYCRDLVEAIPGPVEISPQTFGSDPLVHAIFATPSDIGRMLAASEELGRFCTGEESHGAEAIYALIGMRRREKMMLSPAMKGDLIQVDVPRRLLYFADHTLHEPSADLELTRSRLRDAAFDSLVRSFALKLGGVRADRQEIRSEWEQERALSHISGIEAIEHERRRRELEETLREAAESLEPAHVLDAFVEWLATPQASLRLDEVTVTIDRLGTLVEQDAEANAHTLRLPVLVGRDRRRWIVLVTRIPREDARRARHEAAVARRSLVI